MTTYALFYYTEQEDLVSRPVCILFKADTTDAAITEGMRLRLCAADYSGHSNHPRILLPVYNLPGPRVVELHDVQVLSPELKLAGADTPLFEVVRKQLMEEFQLRKAEREKLQAEEGEARDRREYERLCKKYGPVGTASVDDVD